MQHHRWARSSLSSLEYRDSGTTQTISLKRVIPQQVNWGRSRQGGRRGGVRESGVRVLSLNCHRLMTEKLSAMPPIMEDDARAGEHEDNIDDELGFESDESK